MEVFNIENKFILNSTVENKPDNKSDDLILTGIASTTKEPSLYGEIMTEDALQQMTEQAVNLPILEAHKGDGFENVIGVIINAYVENNDLHIDFKILQNHRQRIQELLDNNVPIGLSIGAQAMIDQDTQQVIGVTLIEVSITPVPANRVAHNTVRVKEDYYTGDCLHGICYAMIKDKFKNVEDNNMAEEKKEKVNPKDVKEEEDSLTIDKVKDMLDERFAEEKEVLIATVVEEVKTELKKLNDKVEETFKIEDAVKKEKPKAKSESEEEEEPKAGASGEEKPEDAEEKPEAEGEGEGEASKEEDEEDKKKKEKQVKASIEIDEDKIVESITERILDSLGEKRNVTGTKTEVALKESTDTQEDEVKPFTSEEAAKLIINDMNRKDPLARAINEAINQ